MFKISRFFTIMFILTSFITRSMGESGVLVRITTPDIFGALAIFFFILSGRSLPFWKYPYIIVFLVTLIIGGIIGLDPFQSMVEIVILLFLFIIFMIIVSIFGTESGVKELVVFIAWAAISASFFGIYDYAAGMTGLPRIFPQRAQGEVLSAFRNSGQAGAYALIMLAVLIPVRVSRFIKSFNAKQRNYITYSIILTLFFMLITGKIAAYIGFGVGVLFFFIYQRNIRAFLMTIVIGSLFFIVYENLDKIAPEVSNRIIQKYNTRVGRNLQEESSILDEDQFIGSNLALAFSAFEDNPLSGSGIGAFGGGIYSKYEIHSTYFKMLGEAGILGVLGYMTFVILFFQKLRYRSQKTPYQEFLYYLFPFIIGCFVSWTYTYHMRKREFWIMFALIVIIDQLIKSGIIADLSKRSNAKIPEKKYNV